MDIWIMIVILGAAALGIAFWVGRRDKRARNTDDPSTNFPQDTSVAEAAARSADASRESFGGSL
jgi:flagellar basal body-associated protein FliL